MKKLLQISLMLLFVSAAIAQDPPVSKTESATNGTGGWLLTDQAASHGWWSAKQSGIIGGIGGTVIGCFGGLLGCLGGFGKARKFVLTAIKFFIGLGILLMLGGLVAIVLKQPFFVWYVLLLPGFVLTFIFGANVFLIKKRYDDLEIRRMASIDAMGS